MRRVHPDRAGWDRTIAAKRAREAAARAAAQPTPALWPEPIETPISGDALSVQILFRNGDSGSLITCTWKGEEIVRSYNGRIGQPRCAPRPETVEEFEATCRRLYLLNSIWQVRHVHTNKQQQYEITAPALVSGLR